MYFDPIPKEKEEDFFNYREELSSLKKLSHDLPITIVKGQRRVGKTSLLKVYYNKIENPKVWIDARIVKENFISHLYESLLIELSHLKGFSLEKVELKLPYLNLSFKASHSFEKAFKEIDKKLKKKVFVFIDEAQLLNSDLSRFLSYAYDNLKNFSFILAGSQIGLLERLVGKGENGYTFLKGRAIGEVSMKRMPLNKSVSFLLEGFSQEKIEREVSKLEEAAKIFSGLMGWLTYYGFYSRTLPHKEAILAVKEKAYEISKEELLSFFSLTRVNRKRALLILKKLTTPSKWEEIRDYVSLKEKKTLSSSSLKRVLDKLMLYSFIEKRENFYYISDNMFSEFVKTLV